MIDRINLADWLAYDRAHPAPTFFARPAWSLALADAFPAITAAPLRIGTQNSSTIMPAMTARTRLHFRKYWAFPLGTYTCFLDPAGGLATCANATAALRELQQDVDHACVIPWPLGPMPNAPQTTTLRHETAVIDCTDGFAAVMRNVRGVTRRMAGQAERRGVRCERASIHDLETYYDILTDASKAWGLSQPAAPLRLLYAVLERGGEDAQLWLARADGTVIGGGIILFGAQELFFWSAAMRREYGRLRPSNALNVALLRAACERGVRWYNLGASEGLEGVARFKSDLGAIVVPYTEFIGRRPVYRIYERMHHVFAHRKRSTAS